MKVNLPEPCHEDWNKMDSQEKGRFCGSCQKLVIDFTQMSDSEIINYFKEYASQKTCGHFKKSQIDRKLKEQETPRRKLFLKELAAACFAFFLASTDAKAQGETILTQQNQNSENPASKESKVIAINGRVKNGDKNVSNAIISIKGTPSKTVSLENGLFSIYIPFEVSSSQDFVTLVVEYADLGIKEMEIATSPTNQFIEIDFAKTKIYSKQQVIQERTITGVMSDYEGQALPGGTVQIKGTNQGTITDMEGNYSLVIPEEGVTLIYHYIGFDSQELEIKDRTVIDVQMTQSVLDGMVIMTGGAFESSYKWYSPRGVWYKIRNIFR